MPKTSKSRHSTIGMLFRYREGNPEERVEFESESPWGVELRNTREESRGPLLNSQNKAREALFYLEHLFMCIPLSCHPVTKYHEWRGVKQHKLIILPFWRLEVQNGCHWAELPPEALHENSFP